MDQTEFPPSGFSEEIFTRALTVTWAYSAYLPNAECLAIVPILGYLPRSGKSGALLVEYSGDTNSVVFRATQDYTPETPLVVFDDTRTSVEMFLETGWPEESSPRACIPFRFELVRADRMYDVKREILQEVGMEEKNEFPVYENRFPVQMLAFMRLARIQDSAQLASVNFVKDIPVDTDNEYESLKIL